MNVRCALGAYVLHDRPALTFQSIPEPEPAAADIAHAHVASPCVQVCLYDRDFDACRGCFRSLEEIAHWSIYEPDEQRAVLERVAERRRQSGVRSPG
jgi:predicted Fe-S protein YdhL (DUF1289 family)